MSFFNELKRRNVLRMAVAYAAVSWLLIQIAETLFPIFSYPLESARMLVIVLAVGFVPAMVLTWVFRLTPGGLVKETNAGEPQLAESPVGSPFDRVIILLLALALGYFAFDKFVLTPQREIALKEDIAVQVESARNEGRSAALIESFGDRSIAVMAFEDMSPEKDQEYLSDGIAEELLNRLAKVPGLRVISRSSAFSYKNKDTRLEQIANELKVAHILQGSVRKSDNQVRITVQLLDAHSDNHLWSASYDRSLDDIFAIQDEIAAAVMAQLKVSLLGKIPGIEEIDPAVYALQLQARHFGRQGTAEGYTQAIALYQQALTLKPDYAAAWNGLATAYSNQASKGLLPYDRGYQEAREAAQHALTINPESPPALARLGWIAMVYENNLHAAAGYLEQALALDPKNLGIIGDSASLLYGLGRIEESIALDEFVNAHDPVNPTGYGNLGRGYLAAGRLDETIAAYQTALQLSPDRIGAHYFIGTALLLKGDAEAALVSMQREKFEVLNLLGQAMAKYSSGLRDESDMAMEELTLRHEQDAAYNIAYAWAWRHETELAFEWLEKAKAMGDPGLADILGEPLFNNLQSDPRWLEFLRSIGKAPEQLDNIPFKVSRG